MSFAEAKVYFDGSHYIAIPRTTRPTKKRPKLLEETITVAVDEVKDSELSEPSISPEFEENFSIEEVLEKVEELPKITEKQPKKTKQITKKELFNELYSKYIDLKKKDRKKMILKDMRDYVNTIIYFFC